MACFCLVLKKIEMSIPFLISFCVAGLGSRWRRRTACLRSKFESKDHVLEMRTAKYHVRIELLNVLKDSWNIWSDKQDYEIRRPDVSIVEQQVWTKRLRVRIEELSVWIGEYSVCIAEQLLQIEALHVSVDKRPVWIVE